MLQRVIQRNYRDRSVAATREMLIMNRRNTLRLLVIGISAVSALDVSANGFRLVDQDAFATARGEAFAATADNASAIYYNPAGIAQLDGTDIRAGLYGIYLDPSFTPPSGAANSGNTYHITKHMAGVPQFFYTHTLEGSPLSYGLGIYSPFGLGVKWPQDTGFRAVAIKGSLAYIRINPVVALKLAPNFSIAAGATANYGNIELEEGLRATEKPFVNFFRFQGEGWTAGYNLGLLWQPHEKVSMGLSFRSPTTITMSGRTEFERQPVIPATNLSAKANFKFPLTAVVGLSYRPTLKWNLEFDADYTDWSSLGVVTLHQQAKAPFPVGKDFQIALDWQPSWLYEFGATRYFESGWHASAGYVYNENSVPDAFYTPLAADLDRHFFSVGAGFKGRRVNFDVAYQFGYGPAHEVIGSTPSSTPGKLAGQTADGTYDFISHAVLVTVGLHF